MLPKVLINALNPTNTQANIYLFKVNNINTRKRWEIRSKLGKHLLKVLIGDSIFNTNFRELFVLEKLPCVSFNYQF